jgi:hypothetical protein
MMKILSILIMILCFASCDKNNQKQAQSIDFGEIAPQQLRDGAVTLQATASSGLPVAFSGSDDEIAVIEGHSVVFKQAGKVNIVAHQAGNEQFYEAPEITRPLLIRDWDPDKQTQEISFELPAEWKLSRDYQRVELNAAASSGLPVSYSLSTDIYGRIMISSGVTYLYLYHAGEGSTPGDKAYDVTVVVTASQEGDATYNPADNVERAIHVIGDVFH